MEDTNRQQRDSDLVLPPKMFAYVLDKTKGNVTTYCGPQKTSLSQTDQPVLYDSKISRFVNVGALETAIQSDVTAKQGEYLVLTNTARDGLRPGAGKAEQMSNDLIEIGKTENIPGPVSFPLWPGQFAEVVKGHHLRSNQYLLVRVYEEEAARENWKTAVIKTVNPTDNADETVTTLDVNTLTTGKLLIIKGTDVSFYIPPTGVEVVKDENNNYVRDAVTLERLEYCILLDENGNKRYLRGPEVVFPEPTETFVTSSSSGTLKRKFRAYELNDNSGLYIKVIADYEEFGNQYKQGQELFLTGKDTAIYFPRQEHAIIKYGDQEKHYAIAIPKGEARYVLDRISGDIELIKGPHMFLADPRKHVVVRRVLDEKTCNLYYPGNATALTHNKALKYAQSGTGYVEENKLADLEVALMAGNLDDGAGTSLTRGFSATRKKISAAASSFGDELSRGTSYTPPRTITLDTKYDGAVTVSPWTGYAIQIVNKNGDRRVIEGPNSVLLEYDEQLEKLTLSTNTPKTDSNIIETVYLRTMSNSISDIIKVKTNDLVDMHITLKYLVRFVGDKNKWFSIENYIQYLCDHIRSMVNNYVRSYEVTNFYEKATEILRDLILGNKSEDGLRPNKLFNENNMEIYDVEVIDIEILDKEIASVLSRAKRQILERQIDVETSEAKLKLVTVLEEAKRGITEEENATIELINRLDREAQLFTQETITAKEILKKERELIVQEKDKGIAIISASIKDIIRAGMEADEELREKYVISAANRSIELLKEQAATDVAKAQAIQPQLVEAIAALAQTGLMEKISGDLAPLSIVQGESVAGTLNNLLKGTPLENVLENVKHLSIKHVNGDARVS